MKMTLTIDIVNNPDLHKYRLLFLASQLKERFYQDRGFLLDINGDIYRKDISVKLNSQIAEFLRNDLDWDQINFITLEDIWNCDLNKIINPSFNYLFNYPIKENPSIVEEWKRYESEVLELFKQFDVPQRRHTIHVVFTNIGTLSSFHPVSYYDKLYVFLREDASLCHLAYSIANLLIKSNIRYGVYEERQKIVRFIFDIPLFKRMIGDYKLSDQRLKRDGIPPGDLITSTSNYDYIGFPIKDPLFPQEGEIYVSHNKRLDNLSEAEKKILNYFINHKATVVTYDNIAEILWGDTFYSLQAITKQMQRLRTKLEKVSKNKLIYTIRGKGYIYKA